MNQLVFLTAFLGLTLGTQPVRLDVKGDIAAVELRLDGQSVATLHGAPWQAKIDLGQTLLPHRLVAVGLDAHGTEIARAEQKINLPRPSAEAAILFDSDAKTQAQHVRLHWTSVDGKPPKSSELRVDGKRVALDAGLTATLPPLSPDTPHLVQATIQSAAGETAEATVIYGGASESQSGALTAVPVMVTGSGPRDAHALAGFFADATAVGIEKPAADVIIVRDPGEGEAAMRLGRPLQDNGDRSSAELMGRGSGLPAPPHAQSSDSWVSSDATARFLWPYAARAESGTPTDLFPSSRRFERSNNGFRWLLTSVSSPMTSPYLRYADAVAVAGLQALARQHPRAIVLVVGDSFRDSSTLTAAQVRAFVASIGVPLFVWSLADAASLPAAAKEWAPLSDITTAVKLGDAVRDLRRAIDSQRIVWLAGDLLPQEVHLTPKAAGVQLLAK
jgi:hypothetical protein